MTGLFLRVVPGLMPGLGHALMLEPGWDDAAARIDGWLTAQGF
ncbi:MAG: hypothetical protein ABFS30_12705 [Pseudomonadota bacterium]